MPQKQLSLCPAMCACIGGGDAVIYYCSLGTWSCPRWEMKMDGKLPAQKDVAGRASSLSSMICV